MKLYLAVILAAFLAALFLTALILPLLRRLKAGQYILGYVKEHKDKGGTPTMGGLAFICAIIVVSLCFCGIHDKTINFMLVIFAGYALIGFLDDFLKIYRKENEGLKPYQKIIFQTAVAIIAAVYCYTSGLTEVAIPFGGGLKVDIKWGIIPLAALAFISAVNCVNLTDGLDGLAGGTSLAYMLIFGLLLHSQGNSMGVIAFAAVGALAGFLVFNINKASVFMGDTGSLALGGIICCLSTFTGNVLYIPIIGITFVISGISVIIQVIYYKRTRRRVFLMAPIHHHFQMKGNSESKISFAYFVLTMAVGLICLLFV